MIVSGLLLLVGSVVFWARPRAWSARAYLAATALLPAVATSAPFGASVIDLAGASGLWPRVLGEALAALGLVALVLSVAGLVDRGARRPWVLAAAVLAPLVGYAAWLGLALDGADSPPARLQVLTTIAVPALWGSVPALLVVATWAHSRAELRVDVLATRMVLLGLAAGIGTWVLLGQVPVWITGSPLVQG